MDERINEIKKFWDSRAKEHGSSWQATLGEKYLRKLEIKTIKKLISRYTPSRVFDVGCGNGYSTKTYAAEFPSIEFVGIDYSAEMIRLAREDQLPNCSFFIGDVLDNKSLNHGDFDIILTQRCLQNLPDYDCQRKAIHNLLMHKSPNGLLLLMECSKDGVAQFNKVRTKMGKKQVENLEPWHNNFFIDKLLVEDFGAEIVYFSSTYMFLAKIVHCRLSALGYVLPAIGKFGYDRLYIIR